MSNVYDNESFFKQYKDIRDNPNSYNTLLEQPAFMAMLPAMEGANVLDLGCGFGEGCREYIHRGAASVLGIDLSEKMIAEARTRTQDDAIEYIVMDLSEYMAPENTYDVVTSSLALHYVEDLASLLARIHSYLKPGGVFLFSQEHPLSTAPEAGPEYYHKGEDDMHYMLRDYGKRGRRDAKWLEQGFPVYHRLFSDIVNELLEAGFGIEEINEPLPSKRAMEQNERLKKECHKPSFIIFKTFKP